MKNLLMIVFAFCAFSVFGQDTQTGVNRDGFFIGVGAGIGVVTIADDYTETSFEETQSGLSLPNLKLGWMVGDRLAVLASLPGIIYEYEGKDRSFEAFIPSVQYWAGDRWWINAGIGLAMDIPALYEVKDFKDEDWNFGCAVSAATGFEIVQKSNFTIDLQTKIHLGSVSLGNDLNREAASLSSWRWFQLVLKQFESPLPPKDLLWRAGA
jgi:hypothetical protein